MSGTSTVSPHGARQIAAATALIADLATRLDIDASVRLWDGSRHPLGRAVTSPLEIVITGPGVIGALIRKPTLDNLIRHYVDRRIDIAGGSLIDLGRHINRGGRSVKLGLAGILGAVSKLSPFLFEPAAAVPDEGGFAGDHVGRKESARDNKAYISFHY
ncbi:MAG: SAM-dependent methyltransferase, partial [Hyphomicrobiaceae bacterium]|nr:SAM-dependent methyltransferase [Hyphomicrobiaceae bacterium]